MLCLIYINDLPRTINGYNLVLFADDSTAPIKSETIIFGFLNRHKNNINDALAEIITKVTNNSLRIDLEK